MTRSSRDVGLRFDADCGGLLALLLQFEDLGSTDDTAERQTAVGDGCLDRFDEALATHDAVTTRQRLHRRLRRQTDDALQRARTPAWTLILHTDSVVVPGLEMSSRTNFESLALALKVESLV